MSCDHGSCWTCVRSPSCVWVVPSETNASFCSDNSTFISFNATVASNYGQCPFVYICAGYDCLDPIAITLSICYLILSILVIFWSRFISRYQLQTAGLSNRYKIPIILAPLVFTVPILATFGVVPILFVLLDTILLLTSCFPSKPEEKQLLEHPIIHKQFLEPLRCFFHGFCMLVLVGYIPILFGMSVFTRTPAGFFMVIGMLVGLWSFMYFDENWNPFSVTVYGGSNPSIEYQHTKIEIKQVFCIKTTSWGGEMILTQTQDYKKSVIAEFRHFILHGVCVEDKGALIRTLVQDLKFEPQTTVTYADTFRLHLLYLGLGLYLIGTIIITTVTMFALQPNGVSPPGDLKPLLIFIPMLFALTPIGVWGFGWWKLRTETTYLNPHFTESTPSEHTTPVELEEDYD